MQPSECTRQRSKAWILIISVSRPWFSGPKVVKGNRGETWLNSVPFDQEGRSVDSLHLEIESERNFQDATLSVHQEWYFGAFKSDDRSICERRCAHSRYLLLPFVIVYKKEGGIRMAVDYREVNQFLRVSANRLPYQDMLFQQLGGKLYYSKVDNLWWCHQLKLDQQSRVYAQLYGFNFFYDLRI